MPKLIKPEFDGEIDEEGMEEEYEEIERGNDVRKPIGKMPQKVKRAVPEQKQQNRYSAFHQSEKVGIVDLETKEIICEDIYTALAIILEKVERIETRIGGMI